MLYLKMLKIKKKHCIISNIIVTIGQESEMEEGKRSK